MACSTCPIARCLSLSVLVVGLVAVASGVIVSSQRTASDLPAPTATVTPDAPETSQNTGELNPVITTRDWQTVDTPVRGKR